MRILHTQSTQIILGNLRQELKELEFYAGLRHVHHHDVVKVGHIYGMTEKINMQEWKHHLKKLLLQVLKFKPLIYLQARKSN